MAYTQSYIISYSLQDELLLPPQLRKPKMVSYLNSISYPLQWLHDITWVDSFSDGFTYPLYSTSSTYYPGLGNTIGDRVIYKDRGVYECIATCSNIDPIKLGSNYWELISDNYIGARERVLYNSQKVLFEYALNKWFQTGVLTIPYSGGIYIINNEIPSTSFLMGLSGEYSTPMTDTTVTQIQWGYLAHSPYNPMPSTDNFTIFVPIAVAQQIDPAGNTYSIPDISPNANTIIRSFADTIKLAGMIYNIKTY